MLLFTVKSLGMYFTRLYLHCLHWSESVAVSMLFCLPNEKSTHSLQTKFLSRKPARKNIKNTEYIVELYKSMTDVPRKTKGVNFQLNVERNSHLLWFCFTLLEKMWFKKIVPYIFSANKKQNQTQLQVVRTHNYRAWCWLHWFFFSKYLF